jgi:hypothetical protein
VRDEAKAEFADLLHGISWRNSSDGVVGSGIHGVTGGVWGRRLQQVHSQFDLQFRLLRVKGYARRVSRVLLLGGPAWLTNPPHFNPLT